MSLWWKRSGQSASPEQMSHSEKPKQLRCQNSSCSSNFKLKTPLFRSGAACDRPETFKTPKLPPIPELVWQQAAETFTDQYNLNIINYDSKKYFTPETSETTVASHTLPPKGNQPQNYVVATDYSPGNQTGDESVKFLNCSENRFTDIQGSEKHAKTTFIGDTTTPPLTKTTPLIEERPARDEETKEFYLPITCTVVLK